MKHAITILAALMLLSFSTAIYLGQLHDVSTIGSEQGDVLTYNGRGWSPSTPVNLTGIGDQHILYEDGDSISSDAQFTYEPAGGPAFGPLLSVVSSGLQGKILSTGSTAGWVSMGTPTNQWDFIGLTGELRMEPSSSEGSFLFRNQGGTDLLSINTSSAIVEVGTASRLRLSGESGNAPVSFVGVDGSDDMAIATQAEARSILGIARGEYTSTTDASGDVTINHGLSATPTAITFQNKDTYFNHTYEVQSKNATSFTVRIRDSGSISVSSAAGFEWIAIE